MEAMAGGILYCVPSCIPMTFLRTMMSDFNSDHATSNAVLMLTHKSHMDFKPSLSYRSTPRSQFAFVQFFSERCAWLMKRNAGRNRHPSGYGAARNRGTAPLLHNAPRLHVIGALRPTPFMRNRVGASRCRRQRHAPPCVGRCCFSSRA